MPIIDMPVDVLMRHINRPPSPGAHKHAAAPNLTEKQLAELLPKIGCGIEETAEMHQYACRRCDKIFDRTEAQGRPLNCNQCGTDFRAAPDQLGDLGPNRVFRCELLAVRSDIFDPGGMARLVRGYLGVDRGLIEYSLWPAKVTVHVDPKLADDASRRPFISCAVLRRVQLDHALVKMLMNLQEDLHWALGRNRKLASIGVYDLDTLQGTQFHYDAVAPDALRFTPLGFPPNDPASALTPGEILRRHPTGRAFEHLLAGYKAVPLLRDGAGTVLSMPPIINSESTRVTLRSKQLFVDVTGLSQRVVDRALNILVTGLKEQMPAIEIEQVNIATAAGSRVTPDLNPVPMTLDVRTAAETIGAPLDYKSLAELLERMGYDVADVSRDGSQLHVLVPAYRNDVMHAIDLIEDAAIAFGYDHLTPALVPTFTVGAPLAMEERSVVARRVLTGLGFHQVMTLALTSAPAAFERWRRDADARAVQIENPISVEQTMLRVSLLPGLLETLAINKQYDLPQQIFEIGDCSFVDPTVETGAREERYVAAALIGTHVGYADVRAVADAFSQEMGASVRVAAADAAGHPSYIPGRVAELFNNRDERVGVIGELHPEVLEKYGLKHATAVLELSLEALLRG
ncbi:MAG: phenylalanine--tRNA ligase subunit beta [Phycisphaerae bacterium]